MSDRRSYILSSNIAAHCLVRDGCATFGMLLPVRAIDRRGEINEVLEVSCNSHGCACAWSGHRQFSNMGAANPSTWRQRWPHAPTQGWKNSFPRRAVGESPKLVDTHTRFQRQLPEWHVEFGWTVA